MGKFNDMHIDLQEWVISRNQHMQRVRELQDEIHMFETKIKIHLIDTGNVECLTVNWQRVQKLVGEQS